MKPTTCHLLLATSLLLFAAGIATTPVSARQNVTPSDSAQLLYEAACAGCHGVGGSGVDAGTVAFDVPVPDFTDCSFASREPDADWIAVAHQGGPVRAFDETMPAFGEALTEEQLQWIIDYTRVFCNDTRWPRGELNLPRPIFTEKAYPEDEAVTTIGVDASGAGAVINEIVYERRFGPRSQIEIEVPFGMIERAPGDWTPGIGDVALGFKHAIAHSLARGDILSIGGEVVLPTGDQSNGFGSGTVFVEPFVAFGKILPSDAFVHLQAIVELPAETGAADSEVVWRAALGRSFSQGRWGRTWSPMIEVLGSAEVAGGTPHWDLVPQMQITLNTRQHVMANIGVRVPVNDTAGRPTQILVYVLWDWFDGGFFDGW